MLQKKIDLQGQENYFRGRKKHLKVGFFSLRTSGLPDFERAWLDTIFVTLLPSFKCPSIRLQRLLILTKLLAQNVDQPLTTKSRQNFTIKIPTKLLPTHSSASKLATLTTSCFKLASCHVGSHQGKTPQICTERDSVTSTKEYFFS